MIINPYSNTTGIRRSDEFFGRTQELRQLYSLIVSGGAISLVGERRVGKSSLLNALALGFGLERISWEPPCPLCFALVDCQFHQDSSESDFLDSLGARIAHAGGFGETEFNRPSLLKMAESMSSCPSPRRLVILLDEVDFLFANQNFPPSLFDFLRALMSLGQVAMVIVSSEGSIDSLLKSREVGSPFWNVFKTFYVGPLAEEEARDLISKPAEQLDCPFSSDMVDHLLQLGGHQPFFLQLACYQMFQERSKHGDTQEGNTLVDLSAVDLEFRRAVSPHFRYLWGRLPGEEQRAVREFMASGVIADPRPQAELIRKGVLIQSKEKKLRLFSKIFDEFVRLSQPAPTPQKVESGIRGFATRMLK
jgi:hypothetical protein